MHCYKILFVIPLILRFTELEVKSKDVRFWFENQLFLKQGVPQYVVSKFCIIFYANMTKKGKKVEHFKVLLAISVIFRLKRKNSVFPQKLKKTTSG